MSHFVWKYYAFFVLNLKWSDNIQVTVNHQQWILLRSPLLCVFRWIHHHQSEHYIGQVFWNGLEMSNLFNKWVGYGLGLTLRTLISTDSFGPDPTRHDMFASLPTSQLVVLERYTDNRVACALRKVSRLNIWIGSIHWNVYYFQNQKNLLLFTSFED